MERDMVKIDEDLCNGCGACVPGCHEGALQIIDGKARLVSDLMCDGLGACIGHCPLGAITIEKREAQPYDEIEVMRLMIPKGKNTVIAHLKHLKDHKEFGYLKQGVKYLRENSADADFDIHDVIREVHHHGQEAQPKQSVLMNPQAGHMQHAATGGCPGSQAMSFNTPANNDVPAGDIPSALQQWPVQMHLINPMTGQFAGSDFLLAADCTAFTLGGFHSKYLKGKTLGIACPKLDSRQETYQDKIRMLIDEARINTLTVMIMEVPCCGGLVQMAQRAVAEASRKIPVKLVVVGIRGDIISEEWI